MEERIAACALNHYDDVLPPTKGKPKNTEWTVYAAFVAVEYQNRGDENEYTRLWVVSCATGTKCATFVPPKDASTVSNVETTILRDCHAEALARRGLLKVLWKEICRNQKEPSTALDSNKNRLLDRLEQESTFGSTTKFKLRSNISLHLYVSDPPCGDASIYPLQDTTSDNEPTDSSPLSSKRSKNYKHEIKFSGAKVIVSSLNGVQAEDCGGSHQLLAGQTRLENSENNPHSNDSIVVAREDVQLLGKLRTKPGRSNLPQHMRSSCMSCSDKIVRWCVLGLQGSILTSYIPAAIRLQSIVVSHDRRALSKSAQGEALLRATQSRAVSALQYLKEQDPLTLLDGSGDNWKGPSVHIVTPRFARGKSSTEYERGHKSPGKPSSSGNSKKRKRDSSSVSPCGMCLSWDQSLAKDVEQIVGARGICQGKKPKSASDYRNSTSRLSRSSLTEHACLVMANQKGEGKGGVPLSYREWKQAHGDEAYQRLRSILFAGGPLAGWLTSS